MADTTDLAADVWNAAYNRAAPKSPGREAIAATANVLADFIAADPERAAEFMEWVGAR